MVHNRIPNLLEDLSLYPKNVSMTTEPIFRLLWEENLLEYCKNNKEGFLANLMLTPRTLLFQTKNVKLEKQSSEKIAAYFDTATIHSFREEEQKFYFSKLFELTDVFLEGYLINILREEPKMLRKIFIKSLKNPILYRMSQNSHALQTAILRIVLLRSIKEYESLNKEQRIHFAFNFSPFINGRIYRNILALYKETVIEEPKLLMWLGRGQANFYEMVTSNQNSYDWLGVKFDELPVGSYKVLKDGYKELLHNSFGEARMFVLFMFFKKYSTKKVLSALNKFVYEDKEFDYTVFESLLLEENSDFLEMPLEIAENIFKPKNEKVEDIILTNLIKELDLKDILKGL